MRWPLLWLRRAAHASPRHIKKTTEITSAKAVARAIVIHVSVVAVNSSPHERPNSLSHAAAFDFADSGGMCISANPTVRRKVKRLPAMTTMDLASILPSCTRRGRMASFLYKLPLNSHIALRWSRPPSRPRARLIRRRAHEWTRLMSLRRRAGASAPLAFAP